MRSLSWLAVAHDIDWLTGQSVVIFPVIRRRSDQRGGVAPRWR
jgi:hypothetical protein